MGFTQRPTAAKVGIVKVSRPTAAPAVCSVHRNGVEDLHKQVLRHGVRLGLLQALSETNGFLSVETSVKKTQDILFWDLGAGSLSSDEFAALQPAQTFRWGCLQGQWAVACLAVASWPSSQPARGCLLCLCLFNRAALGVGFPCCVRSCAKRLLACSPQGAHRRGDRTVRLPPGTCTDIPVRWAPGCIPV